MRVPTFGDTTEGSGTGRKRSRNHLSKGINCVLSFHHRKWGLKSITFDDLLREIQTKGINEKYSKTIPVTPTKEKKSKSLKD